MKAPTESDVMRQCLQLLALRGVFAFRVNNTGIRRRDRSGREFWAFNGTPGVADILAVLTGGRLLALECKKPGGRLSETQKAFGERIEASGGVYLCVSSVEELLKFLGEQP